VGGITGIKKKGMFGNVPSGNGGRAINVVVYLPLSQNVTE
jgi:hypothetical protein